jgi:hypothetical protein
MVDLDDPDPSGSYSTTTTFEHRRPGAAFSLGIEGGVHRYLTMRQVLAPDVTGWSSKLEDIRASWRLTPFVRWGTRGSNVRLYGQLGMGLYVRQSSYFQQERERGVLVLDMRHESRDPAAGINLGLGLELFPGSGPLGLTFSYRAHSAIGGGDGFNTGEVGVVYRWGKRSRRP